MQCVLIQLDGGQKLVLPLDSAWEIIKAELEGMSHDEFLTLSKKEMSQEQFDNLREFEGF